MTQDEIIRMAREAGFVLDKPSPVWLAYQEEIERFAALVAAHEREKQEEQEPVRIENIYKRGDKYFAWIGDDYVQIYTAPVQQVDLTDDEIFKLFYSDGKEPIDHYEFARAVIAADREKNK